MTDYAFHPIADVFPLMAGADYDELVADIREHGLREPIVLYDDRILDGRNRYRACADAEVEPRFTVYEGDDPASYSESLNIHRRHLKTSQRALAAARLANMPGGRPKKTIGKPTVSKHRAAELMNVNSSSVSDARRVLAEATPDEVALVEAGRQAVTTLAADIRAGLTPEEREEKRQAPKTRKNTADSHAVRIENARRKAHVWGTVRDAINALASLPLPADVAPIARSHDRGGLVDEKLNRAREWLEEFAHVWRGSEDHQHAAQAESGGDDHHPANGGAVA